MAEKKFEDTMNRLEEIVNSLEHDDLTLDESLKIFEEGMEHSKFCYEKLNQAEQKLKKLISEPQCVDSLRYPSQGVSGRMFSSPLFKAFFNTGLALKVRTFLAEISISLPV